MSKEKASIIWLKMETMQPCGSFKARNLAEKLVILTQLRYTPPNC
jgi:threonine dehydratase